MAVPPADLPSPSRRGFLRSAAGGVLIVGLSQPLLSACAGDGASQGLSPSPSTAAAGRTVALYRQEGCSCCTAYADYLRERGYAVDVTTLPDLDEVRREHRIPADAVGCHTSVTDGYVVEGHVPVEAIERLLDRRPDVDGISVVGMPLNAPGMGEPGDEPLDVLSFRNGQTSAFMSVDTF